MTKVFLRLRVEAIRVRRNVLGGHEAGEQRSRLRHDKKQVLAAAGAAYPIGSNQGGPILEYEPAGSELSERYSSPVKR